VTSSISYYDCLFEGYEELVGLAILFDSFLKWDKQSLRGKGRRLVELVNSLSTVYMWVTLK